MMLTVFIVVKHKEPPDIWRNDRFNERKPDIAADMVKNCNGMASQEELETKLQETNKTKRLCMKIITNITNEMWILIINACEFHHMAGNLKHNVRQKSEIKLVLREIEDDEVKYAFCYFLFNFVHKKLYTEVTGSTHKDATEHMIECVLNVTFYPTDNERTMTCINKLYSLMYNNLKQNILKAILPSNITISVEHQLVEKPIHWKRDNYTYFIHTSVSDKMYRGGPKKQYIKSEEVRF